MIVSNLLKNLGLDPGDLPIIDSRSKPIPGEVNLPGLWQSPHVSTAAAGNVKMRLQVVHMINSRCIFMVSNYSATRDNLAVSVA